MFKVPLLSGNARACITVGLNVPWILGVGEGSSRTSRTLLTSVDLDLAFNAFAGSTRSLRCIVQQREVHEALVRPAGEGLSYGRGEVQGQGGARERRRHVIRSLESSY